MDTTDELVGVAHDDASSLLTVLAFPPHGLMPELAKRSHASQNKTRTHSWRTAARLHISSGYGGRP
jgi:hypothetical protein